jgi:hypothetical protein
MGTISNEELVQKAIVTTDAIASSGKLNPQQANKFIDYVFDLSGLKNAVRTVKFSPEELNIDKIGVGKRVAVPASEAVAPSVRRGVNTSKVTLKPVEIMVPFEIGDTFKEINIEQDQVEDHIIKMMATQLANDLETLYIEGDALGRADLESNLLEGGSTTLYVKDTYLALFDGWLRKADSANIVDLAGQNIGTNVFSRMLNAMPAKFKRDRSNLRFATSLDLEQNYRERVSTRATAEGDRALGSLMPLTPFGVPLVPFPLYPYKYREVEHVTLNGTTAVSLRRTNISNVVVTKTTLAGMPEAKYVNDTDYDLDLAAGTIARDAAGAITDGQTVKVTYDALPTVLLTHMSNLIIGIGRDIRIEKDRDIFRRANQYAITLKAACEIEEVTAVVKGVNVGTGT